MVDLIRIAEPEAASYQQLQLVHEPSYIHRLIFPCELIGMWCDEIRSGSDLGCQMRRDRSTVHRCPRLALNHYGSARFADRMLSCLIAFPLHGVGVSEHDQCRSTSSPDVGEFREHTDSPNTSLSLRILAAALTASRRMNELAGHDTYRCTDDRSDKVHPQGC